MANRNEIDRGNALARARGAYLVGSVPLADSEAVFREVSATLGAHLRRIPDGETGIRKDWIQWQFPLLLEVPEFEAADEPAGPYGPRLQLRAGVSPEDIVFPEPGYRAAALESYSVFTRLKDEGVIADHVRFQVCLPTPLAVVLVRFIPAVQEVVEQAYKRKMLEELDRVLAAIPADQLAIQWDTAVEFAVLERVVPSFLGNPEDGIEERLIRLGNHVPPGVEMGFHLCYGDANHQHFVEPADSSKLVSVANGVCAGVERSVDWLHMPVPRERNDEAYFTPLSGLRLQAKTECYLGLVHMTDGVAGTQSRITAAQSMLTDFGVATECGLGRRPAETIRELLEIHANVSDPL